MAQLIPTVPGIGAAFGTGVGSGFSKTLDKFLEAKIKQMVQAPEQERLAEVLAYLGVPEGQTGQQAEELSPQQAQQAPNALSHQQVQPGIQKNPLLEALQRGNVGQQELMQLTGSAPQTAEQAQATPTSPSQFAAQKPSAKPRQLDRETFRKLLATLPVHLQPQALAAWQGQQAKIVEREKEERKTEQLSQREINKRTQPFYDSIISGERTAKETKHTLKKLKELEKGDLPPAGVYNLLKSLESIGTTQGAAIGGAIGGALGTGTGALLGGPLGATLGLTEGSAAGAAIGGGLGAAIKPITSIFRSILTHVYPDTEEYEKTALEFVKQARPLIGGHVTENQLDLLMKRIPTLATTKNGREHMINNIGVLAEGSTADYDALEQIIKENGGERPKGFEFKVMKRADEIRANAAKRWID
jgi:hypothetical protein